MSLALALAADQEDRKREDNGDREGEKRFEDTPAAADAARPISPGAARPFAKPDTSGINRTQSREEFESTACRTSTTSSFVTCDVRKRTLFEYAERKIHRLEGLSYPQEGGGHSFKVGALPRSLVTTLFKAAASAYAARTNERGHESDGRHDEEKGEHRGAALA